MYKYTPEPPPHQDPPFLLVTREPDDAFNYFGVCPSSQTYVAFSGRHRCQVLITVSCKRWRCRTCAEKKIKRLSYQVASAHPTRLLTLTIDPSLFHGPREAFDQTRRCVPILIRQLRTRYGEVEYLRVTEVTRNGFPHYHLLVRSGFLPHQVIKDMWGALTGARIVDIRQVKKRFSAYLYLVKYLSKLHEIPWTARHISMSRNFFPREEPDPTNDLEITQGELFFCHPTFYVTEHCLGWTLTRISKDVHALQPKG